MDLFHQTVKLKTPVDDSFFSLVLLFPVEIISSGVNSTRLTATRWRGRETRAQEWFDLVPLAAPAPAALPIGGGFREYSRSPFVPPPVRSYKQNG